MFALLAAVSNALTGGIRLFGKSGVLARNSQYSPEEGSTVQFNDRGDCHIFGGSLLWPAEYLSLPLLRRFP